MGSTLPYEDLLAFNANPVWKIPCSFQKTCLKIWIANKKVERAQALNKGCLVSVRSVIPSSRLASYDDYPYDVEHECLYAPDTSASGMEVAAVGNIVPGDPIWMCPQVQKEFAKIVSVQIVQSVPIANWICQKYPGLARNCQPSHPFDDGNVMDMPCLACELESLTEIELQMRIKSTQKLWDLNYAWTIFRCTSKSGQKEAEFRKSYNTEKAKKLKPISNLAIACRCFPGIATAFPTRKVHQLNKSQSCCVSNDEKLEASNFNEVLFDWRDLPDLSSELRKLRMKYEGVFRSK